MVCLVEENNYSWQQMMVQTDGMIFQDSYDLLEHRNLDLIALELGSRRERPYSQMDPYWSWGTLGRALRVGPALPQHPISVAEFTEAKNKQQSPRPWPLHLHDLKEIRCTEEYGDRAFQSLQGEPLWKSLKPWNWPHGVTPQPRQHSEAGDTARATVRSGENS